MGKHTLRLAVIGLVFTKFLSGMISFPLRVPLSLMHAIWPMSPIPSARQIDIPVLSAVTPVGHMHSRGLLSPIMMDGTIYGSAMASVAISKRPNCQQLETSKKPIELHNRVFVLTYSLDTVSVLDVHRVQEARSLIKLDKISLTVGEV